MAIVDLYGFLCSSNCNSCVDELNNILADINRVAESVKKIQQQKVTEVANYRQCVACMERDKSVLFMPCRHLCVCTECSKEVVKCPVCTSGFSARDKLYTSL